MAWDGLDDVLQMVADGRGDGLPWAGSAKAHAHLRLDVAVDARFGPGTAEQVLPAMEAAGLIKVEVIKVPKKPRGTQPMRAWVVCTALQNPEAVTVAEETV
jgi:hypothetical protein